MALKVGTSCPRVLFLSHFPSLSLSLGLRKLNKIINLSSSIREAPYLRSPCYPKLEVRIYFPGLLGARPSVIHQSDSGRVWFWSWWPGELCTLKMCIQKMWQHTLPAAVSGSTGSALCRHPWSLPWCLDSTPIGFHLKQPWGGNLGVIPDCKASSLGSWAYAKVLCATK